MDDVRIEWLRNRVYDSLDVHQKDSFDELLCRDDGKAELQISKYFDESSEDSQLPLMFYKIVLEQEEEVEVECGASTSCVLVVS